MNNKFTLSIQLIILMFKFKKHIKIKVRKKLFSKIYVKKNN